MAPDTWGIETIYAGQRQILARLSLPSAITGTLDQFGLHPSIIDAALQAALFLIDSDQRKPFLPLNLKELIIYGKCTGTMWAHLRCNNAGTLPAQRFAPQFDIDFCDENGLILIRMKQLEFQENLEIMAPEPISSIPFEAFNTPEASELMTFEEIWREETLAEAGAGTPSSMPQALVCFLSEPENQQILVETFRAHHPQTEVVFVSHGLVYQQPTRSNYVVVKADGHTYREAFQNIHKDYGEVDAILYLWPLEDSGSIEDYTVPIHILQAMNAAKLTVGRVQFAAACQNGLERCYAESWLGFERTLRLIMPGTQLAVFYQAASGPPETMMLDWANKLRLELRIPKAQSAKYCDGKRYVAQISPTSIPPASSGQGLLKSGATYLITGGCGGLGLLFAEHLAKLSTKAEPVNLILTGRSEMDVHKQFKIKALEAFGSRVEYIQADVCDFSAMQAGLNPAKERFGNIQGVIHAAGVAGSQTIFENDITIFQRVLDPKIKGTLVLDELLREEALDFICYFSSTAAILGGFRLL